MASFSHFFLFVALISFFLSLSQSQSSICSSQSFPNRTFTHCEDLPELNAFLHYTYDPNNSSLSIAFLASPARPGGWVAWAINPTSVGMIGSQAFIATLSDNTPTVGTFNISSYSSVLPSPSLSFPFWDIAAESSDDQFIIFASVKVPPNSKSLNQVWQVGSVFDTDSGVPMPHYTAPDNLNAKGVLVFDKESAAPNLHATF